MMCEKLARLCIVVTPQNPQRYVWPRVAGHHEVLEVLSIICHSLQSITRVMLREIFRRRILFGKSLNLFMLTKINLTCLSGNLTFPKNLDLNTSSSVASISHKNKILRKKKKTPSLSARAVKAMRMKVKGGK